MIKVRRTMFRRGSLGLSLIEILIATVIFSILLLGFTSLFKFSLMAWVKTVGRFGNSTNLGGAFDVMASDIRSALPPYSTCRGVKFEAYDVNGSPSKTLTNSIADELQFHVATYSTYEGQVSSNKIGGEVVKRGYWLRRDTTNDTRVEQGRDVSSFDNSSLALDYCPSIPAGFSTQDEFAYRVRDWNVEYYDGSSWTNSWLTSSTNALPKLVRVSMTTTGGGITTTMQTVIAPRAQGIYLTR